MHDHEILELLLYYAIPRVNVNPLAHRLLDTFGSLYGVLNASPDALRQVKGIGDASAVFLTLFRDVMRRYAMDKKQGRHSASLTTAADLADHLQHRFAGLTEERLIALATDAGGRSLGCAEISRGTTRATDVNIRRLAEFAIRYQASNIILAHNHPGGIPVPSAEDLSATRYIREVLGKLSIALHDHIIFADDGEFISMRDSGMLRYVNL